MGKKAKDSLQQFIAPKQKNEHKTEASLKKLMNWKTVQKSLDSIKKCTEGMHTEEKTKEDGPN